MNQTNMINIILNHERNLSNMLQCYQQSNLIELYRLQIIQQIQEQQTDTSHLVEHIVKNEELFLIDTFSNIENPMYTTCPITQEDFSNDDEVILLKHCNHLFKKQVFLSWMRQSKLCPYCRESYL